MPLISALLMNRESVWGQPHAFLFFMDCFQCQSGDPTYVGRDGTSGNHFIKIRIEMPRRLILFVKSGEAARHIGFVLGQVRSLDPPLPTVWVMG